jgi:predicted nucleic acid-binding protein
MARFVDTTFWIALLNPKDAHHAAAAETMASIAAEGGAAPPLVYSDYVFDELVTTTLAQTKRHDKAVRAGRALLASKGARLVRISERTFEDAWELFQKRRDKRWSFTDCTSFRMMEALGIDTALSFDSDFREAGFNTAP